MLGWRWIPFPTTPSRPSRLCSARPVSSSCASKHDLPEEQRFGAKSGMTVNGSRVTSPVRMWLHALEALLQRLKVRGRVPPSKNANGSSPRRLKNQTRRVSADLH